ncbi:GFA family protein [Vibrio cyclitrophicus]|uniref:GFA family protein n=1 Tax=Vibrio cyclitrophicus TaxID=47951 RepID=UPI0020C05670|nr:GFA family protein [Vibrio cyclitrophicus]
MKGSCLCGDIQFEVKGVKPSLYQCHCSVCRKSTGSSSNTAAIVNETEFNWIKKRRIFKSLILIVDTVLIFAVVVGVQYLIS